MSKGVMVSCRLVEELDNTGSPNAETKPFCMLFRSDIPASEDMDIAKSKIKKLCEFMGFDFNTLKITQKDGMWAFEVTTDKKSYTRSSSVFWDGDNDK